MKLCRRNIVERNHPKLTNSHSTRDSSTFHWPMFLHNCCCYCCISISDLQAAPERWSPDAGKRHTLHINTVLTKENTSHTTYYKPYSYTVSIYICICCIYINTPRDMEPCSEKHAIFLNNAVTVAKGEFHRIPYF